VFWYQQLQLEYPQGHPIPSRQSDVALTAMYLAGLGPFGTVKFAVWSLLLGGLDLVTRSEERCETLSIPSVASAAAGQLATTIPSSLGANGSIDTGTSIGTVVTTGKRGHTTIKKTAPKGGR
jgi:hypothetical protein